MAHKCKFCPLPLSDPKKLLKHIKEKHSDKYRIVLLQLREIRKLSEEEEEYLRTTEKL